jgi:hypothetical protein
MKTVIVAFFLVSICFIPLASASTSVLVTPTTKVLTVGDTFTISLVVTPDQEVDTIAVDLLTWNNNVLDCIIVEKGNFFVNPLIWMQGNIHNDVGKLELMLMASSTPTKIPDILCNITFKAKNNGISVITIETFGVARNGTDLPKEILNSCQVTIQPQSGDGSQQNPPINNENNTENQTLPPINETTPENNTANETQSITNDNSTNNSANQTVTGNNDIGIPDTISPTIILYAAIIIIAGSVISIIIVHHFKEKKEDEEEFDIDEFFNKKEAENGKTDSGSQLQK